MKIDVGLIFVVLAAIGITYWFVRSPRRASADRAAEAELHEWLKGNAGLGPLEHDLAMGNAHLYLFRKGMVIRSNSRWFYYQGQLSGSSSSEETLERIQWSSVVRVNYQEREIPRDVHGNRSGNSLEAEIEYVASAEVPSSLAMRESSLAMREAWTFGDRPPLGPRVIFIGRARENRIRRLLNGQRGRFGGSKASFSDPLAR